MKDVLKLCKWAKKNGAVSIKVEGVEILFPPPELEPEFQTSTHKMAVASPMPSWREEMLGQTPQSATPKSKPAISSENDHPDVYARDVDAWANQRPLGRR